MDRAVKQVEAFLKSATAPPAEWSRASFANFRTGLNSVEAGAFLAREVLIAIEQSDAAVHGYAGGAPFATGHEPPAMKVRLLAEMLRSIAQTDPLVSVDPDPVNKNGEAAYRTMLRKIGDREVARRARATLGIDPLEWLA